MKCIKDKYFKRLIKICKKYEELKSKKGVKNEQKIKQKDTSKSL